MNVLTPSLEDYLEAVYIISLKKKVVRVKDLMNYFNYKVSSINHALKILKDKNLVIHEKYGYIEISGKGLSMAKKLYDKHKNITKFFINILGVDAKIAEEDACAIEHYLHKETYDNWCRLTKYIEPTDDGKSCMKGFVKTLNKK